MTYTIKAKYVDIENGTIDENVHYGDGTRALAMWHDESYGRPETLSVNLGEYGVVPPDGHVYVRDDEEHEGLPDALVEAGVARKVCRVHFGPYDSTAWLVEVLAW